MRFAPCFAALTRCFPHSAAAAALRRLVWASGAAQRGYTVEYPRISLHAISREESEEFPRPCIYCQVDAGGETLELRLVPHDPEQRSRRVPDA